MKGKYLGLMALMLTVLGTGFTFSGWQSQVAEGNKLMQDGSVESAVAVYQESLVDAPDEPIIHYNLGNALYAKGDFAKASEQFTRTRQLTEDKELDTQAEYNLGNSTYKEGAGLEQTNPNEAMNRYKSALQHFKNVMKADSTDEDAKYNYEFVQKKLKDLEEKMQNQQNDEHSNSSQDGEQKQEEQNGDQKDEQGDSGDQNSTQDNQGQKSDQESTEGEQNNQQSKEGQDEQSQNGENGQGEEESDQSATGAEKTDGDEASQQVQGLTKAQALQLLEQFKDQGGEFIPVKPDSNDQRDSSKDW